MRPSLVIIDLPLTNLKVFCECGAEKITSVRFQDTVFQCEKCRGIWDLSDAFLK